MFTQTFKTTLKNLVRSLLFWAALAIVIFVVIYYLTQSHQGYFDLTSGETITDLDPRYVMSYYTYLLLPMNFFRAGLMFYAMPVFTVISTLLVMNRSYGDGFFEIEKAGGVKPSVYFFGRFSALVTVNVAVSLIISVIGSLTYYCMRGGYDGFAAFGSFLYDYSARFFRLYIIAVIPAILLYMGLTYMIGSIFKSGFAGAVIGFGYTLMTYLCNYQLRFRMPNFYNDFITPTSSPLYLYLSYYKTVEIEDDTMIFNFVDTIVWLGIILGTSILCFAISYICTRRRKI